MRKGSHLKINYYLTHPNEDLLKLNDEERSILQMRFGLGRYIKHHSLREISLILTGKNTHAWARDRLNKILKKVRYKVRDAIND